MSYGFPPPRLLPSPAAAAYLGVSESMLRKLGIPRKEQGAKRLYDRSDLDAHADDLPYEVQPENRNNEEKAITACDDAFGMTK
ncbi:helix-turn-helix domain-containing protein [Parasedimentitalea huanghaiensis]|uniref:DNA-binding protein n=1 Tax=Parasedimentitalea huanghaiensis TaxID=2682100 RepID=A0A6L6WMC4_9RHOB|nr:helix-turn-helix domain-containing protein [Zongyanglinia huanghaiensis]MVO17137.1 DNA-binding protein [Zongyanglinia huanghaiensis]